MNSNLSVYETKRQKRQHFRPSQLGLILSLPKQVIQPGLQHSPLLKENLKKTKKAFYLDKRQIQMEKIHSQSFKILEQKKYEKQRSYYAVHNRSNMNNQTNLFDQKVKNSKKNASLNHLTQNASSTFYQTLKNSKCNSKNRLKGNQMNLTVFNKSPERNKEQVIEYLQTKQKQTLDNYNPEDSSGVTLPKFPRFQHMRNTFYSQKNTQFKTINILRKTIIASHCGFYGTYFKKKKIDQPFELQIRQAAIGCKVVTNRSPKVKNTSALYEVDGLAERIMRKRQKKKKSRGSSRSQIRGWDTINDDNIC